MTEITINAEAGDSPSTIALKIELEKLRAEYEALKARRTPLRKPSMKVSDKGAMSLYGLGRFPVTLYKAQWLRLLEQADSIREFLKANDALLTVKEDESPEEKAAREAHNAAQIAAARGTTPAAPAATAPTVRKAR